MSNSESKTGKKRIKAWKIIIRIATVATIVGAIAAVFAIWPESQKKKLKKEIIEQITTIEQTFHPKEITIDTLSSPDLQYLKDFQTAMVESARSLKSIFSMRPISELELFSVEQLLSVQTEQLKVINNFEASLNGVTRWADSLGRYGKANNIEYYMPKYDILESLLMKSMKRMELGQKLNQKVIDNILGLIKKYGINVNGVSGKEVKKALRPLEKHYNSKKTLVFIKENYSYYINENNNYMYYLNNVKTDTK